MKYQTFGLLVVAFLSSGDMQAQQAGGAQEKVAALKQSLAKNQAALKKYAWTETTQISLKGEVKKTEQKSCLYGPDGKVQKTPMQGSSGEQQQQAQSGRRGRRGGLVKKEVVQHKVGEMKDYMEQVAALVHEYAPPDPQKMQAAQAAGNVSVQPGEAGGITTITFKNYLKQGDSLVLGFDAAAKKIRSYNVQSYLEDPKKDAVTLAVSFDNLPDGTNYVKQTILNAAGKQIGVTTTNSDYKKIGS